MRGAIVLLLCCLPGWAGNACVSQRSGDWGDGSLWGNCGGAAPGDGDTAAIADGHTVTVRAGAVVGASGRPVYSYISSVSIAAAGSGGSGGCALAFTGGTPNGSGQAGSCALSGGGVAAATLYVPRRWYAAASAQPACTFTAGGLSGQSCATVWQQGGGTPAVHLGASGQLVIAGGAALTVRGDILYTHGAANQLPGVILQAGSGLVFDSSQAAGLSDGRKPMYSYGGTGSGQYRAFVISGSASSHASVSSSGNPGMFTTHDFGVGGSYTWEYGAISGMGDETSPAIWSEFLAGSSVTWDIQRTTFDRCGRLQRGLDADNAVFRHNYNRHTNTAGSTPMFLVSSKTTGIRELKNNYFDKQFGNGVINTGGNLGMVVENNIFADGSQSAQLAASMVGNAFLGTTSFTLNSGNAIGYFGPGVTCQTARDNFFAFIGPKNNPHVVGSGANAGSLDICKVVFWPSEDLPATGFDMGEVVATSPGAGITAYYSYWLNLPNRRGYASAQLTSVMMTNGSRVSFEHSTSWAGYSVGPAATPSAVIRYNENTTLPTGSIASMKSNLGVSYTGGTRPFTKLNRVNEPRVTLNICTQGNCDYNAVYGPNYSATDPTCTTDCAGQGNGYIGKFDHAPGTHDWNVDPQLVNYRRTPEFFDSMYLGRTFPAWEPVRTYGHGQEVSHAAAGYSWGLPVNYRCYNPNGCPAGQEPGNTAADAAWYSNWEFSTLFSLREAALAGRVYADGALVEPGDAACTPASPCGPVVALIHWVRRGYTPQNARLFGAGHDGKAIGAAPMERPRMFPTVSF